MTDSTTKPEYILPVNETEWDRLDAQSNAMDKLLGNKLCPEDIGQPRKILEIGAGSGAWAIHAAKLYPEADVLAIDMNPLPARPLPPNVSYKQFNVLEPFPFPKGTFDIVHIRLTLCHLPDASSVLSRIIDLVAPGGWLLADELNWSENFEGLDNAPSTKATLLFIIRLTQAAKGDPHFGTTLKPYLESSSQLSEVHVREVDVSLNAIPDGTEPLLAEFSRTFKETFTRAIADAPTQTPDQKEMQQGFLADMARDGADWQYTLQFYFTWSKKRA
ncbi:Methyltransferase str2 [Mycena sanguinolenta]|uniref:Methyltransferase str2 n=1 Tax=Mycena sanguinolenta TaxID=230812 RepID=A0A8H7DA27_9AGAR|nr:Methyltransferase str2 [Mycena sanguinolenta]